jgi:hypothetical protein
VVSISTLDRDNEGFVLCSCFCGSNLKIDHIARMMLSQFMSLGSTFPLREIPIVIDIISE